VQGEEKGTGYFYEEGAMKRKGGWLAMIVAVVMVGLIGCGQEAPKNGVPSAPAATSKPATDSTGQAVVDSIKAPLDKARGVEGTLEKAAGKTADQIKDATP